MGKIKVMGGCELSGEMKLQGSKNAALPILAACLLNGGESRITNCPVLSDVSAAAEILKELGCVVTRCGEEITVNSSNMVSCEIPDRLMRGMRSSIMFLGPILARYKKAVVSYPGGCEIGLRPVDYHIKALKQLGVLVREEHGMIFCESNKMKGAKIHLDFPSVGATENVMMAASVAEGETVLSNAACEPEIENLQDFINSMGGDIKGAGSNEIHIKGVKKFTDTEHKIIPDRIVGATYLCAVAATGGRVLVRDITTKHLQAVLTVLEEMGCGLKVGDNEVEILSHGRLKSVNSIITQVYPGFPTDAQALIMSCLATADGTSVVEETIFENRFWHIEELNKMGADIIVGGRCAVVRGVKKLEGTAVSARDLRGGAALVVAALGADGETVIEGTEYIDRGYQEMEKALCDIGAKITRMP